MSEYIVRDSGEPKDSFEGGAVRDNQEGKPRYSLIPPPALRRLADHYSAGAKKYADHNYLKGMPTGRILDSLMRHVELYRDGDRVEDHPAAIAWNAFAIMMFENTKWDDTLEWQYIWNAAIGQEQLTDIPAAEWEVGYRFEITTETPAPPRTVQAIQSVDYPGHYLVRAGNEWHHADNCLDVENPFISVSWYAIQDEIDGEWEVSRTHEL